MLKAVRRIPCLILAVIDVIGPGIYGGKLHGPTVLLQAQQGGIVARQQQARCANAAIKIEQASGAGVLVTLRRAVSQKNALCRMSPSKPTVNSDTTVRTISEETVAPTASFMRRSPCTGSSPHRWCACGF